MIFTQLRSFHAVAAAKGFTAASNVLNVGQPTLTSQVRALEEMYQVELFHRRGEREAISRETQRSDRTSTPASSNALRIARAFSSAEGLSP